ncbi:MAG: LysM peptidoglycan-binding domain-containing protein, partial [Actinomycetota bacterium]
MERRTRERLQGVVALTVIMTITFGVPAILVRVAGWPMPRSMPDWSRVRVALMQGDIPAETVVKALAVVVWLIWLQVVWALAWECVVNVPRVTAGRRPKSAPLVANPVGNGVGRLVALVMSIGLTIATMPATAIALPSAPIDMPPAANPTSTLAMASTQGQPVEQSIAAPRWKVDKQDSLWRIAEIALGEGDRSNEILELNSWLRSPRDVRAGHVLVLPFDAGVPEDRQPPVDPDPSASPNDGNGVVTYLAPSHIVIEPGDNLWDLSEDRLSIVDPDVTPRETLDQLNAVIALNPDVVEDPNLIYPGEVFEFPAVGAPPAPEAPVVDTGDPAVDVVEDPDAIQPGPPATVVEQPAEPSPVATTAPAPRAGPVPVTSVVHQAGSDPAIWHDVHGSRSVAPWVAGISGATVLASGLVLMYRRRIALRAARGARAYRASTPDDPTVLAAITRASDVSLLRWANHELAELFARMRPGDVAGMPLAVELSQTHGIEMLWTGANPQAPRPWEATDGGWSWRLLYDPDLPLPEIEQAAVLPALVTIGTRDGNQLLVNLEAFGALAIDATEQTAQAFARSIVIELSAGELLSDAYLSCAGLDLAGALHFDRIQRCDEADANQRLENAVTSSEQFLAER